MRSVIGMELCAVLFALSGISCETALRPQRVILIVIDTLRSDHVSCYGSASATPAIDAIAARGQRFTRATSSFHQTSMSMGAMFTGRTPSIETGELKTI